MSVLFDVFMAALSLVASASGLVLSITEASPFFMLKGIGFLLIGIGYILEIWRKRDG